MDGLKYRVLCADPPWRFNDKLPGKGRGAAKHYDVMTTEQLFQFQLPPLEDDCYMFMWRVAAMQYDALELCKAWGFTPKTELVWVKKTKTGKRWFGMGHHLRAEHESCIVATRGRPKPRVRNIRTVFEAKAGRHSEKPDEFFEIVENFSDGPYVELFARRRRKGWMCYGNEI